MKKLILMTAFFAVFFVSTPIFAHPGNTASDGCHYCRTNCDSWGVPWNVRHCHNGSVVPAPTYTPPKPVYKPTVTTKTEINTEVIPFETISEDDPNLEEGKSLVKQEGTSGIKTITFKITYTDGKETNREKTGETVTTQPINKIILQGTKKITDTSDQNVPEVKGETEVAGWGAETTYGLIFLLAIVLGIFYLVKWVAKKIKRNNT